MSIGLQLNIFYWFKSFNKSLSSSCIISFSTFFYLFNFSVWHLLYTIICAFYYFMYSVSILWLFSFYALEFVLKYSDLMFCKKGVLKNFAKFTGKHLCQIFFFLTKLQAKVNNTFFTEQLRATASVTTIYLRNIFAKMQNILIF